MCMQHVRQVVANVLSSDDCRELTYIHKALAGAGYSKHLLSTRLNDVAYTEPALLIPLVAARDKVAAAAEKVLNCPFELCVEYSGLVSWTEGANIDWHYDSNRPYLKQRHATAVAYLNEGADFEGGILEFRDGTPSVVTPSAGSMVAFLADESNTHRVTEVTAGERLTLTLWFTLLPEHIEDKHVLRQLSSGCHPEGRPNSMYADVCGNDLRVWRLQQAGLSIIRSTSNRDSAAVALHLLKEGEPCSQCAASDGELATFDNLQEALIVVAFHRWKYAAQPLEGCGCHVTGLLLHSRQALHLYLSELRVHLGKAHSQWRQAGLLFDPTGHAF